MTGPEHYLQAERLPGHAGSMLETGMAPEDRAELVQLQAAVIAMATAHAALADAAVAGLSAHLDTADRRAWRRVAGTALDT